MQIVDADIRVLQQAARRGRVRSAETQKLIDTIDQLTPGKAKAVVVTRGIEPEKVRARVTYAAKLAGKPLQIAIDDNRVLFALKEQMRRRGRPRKNPR